MSSFGRDPPEPLCNIHVCWHPAELLLETLAQMLPIFTVVTVGWVSQLPKSLALSDWRDSVPLPYLAVILCLSHLPEELGLPFCSLSPSAENSLRTS